jgi:protein-glutamine gamma-glutamyltransferase
MGRTLLLCAGPAALLAWSWLRLERPHVGGGTALWLIALAVVPALLPRLRRRLLALAATSVLALHTAFGIWAIHPGRLLSRFGGGFLEFYDVRLPFAAAPHPRMEGVILIALFASCALVALVIAARGPVLAALTLLVASGWPATLLIGPDDLNRGIALLALILLLVVGLGERPQPRRLLFAGAVGGAVVLAAFAASSSSAVATGQVLHWQGWDFYTKPEKPVGVQYVWNSDYRGFQFPKKVTSVLKIKAPARRSYWRATTLDEFDGKNWFEYAVPVGPTVANGRYELTDDSELPGAARDRSRWVKQEVTVEALHDNHLTGASVPVAYDPGSLGTEYAAGGLARLPASTLSPGNRYTVWSYEPHPSPRQLARLIKPHYPELVKDLDLRVTANASVPPFGASGREVRVEAVFDQSSGAAPYRAVYETAKRVVGRPPSPYAAAVELEAWFRSGGVFRYDEHPPQSSDLPPLAAFVLRTHRGYCQHFAGAMALMLRYLGIPARVAAGFTSGVYDAQKHEWVVTDHDAHTWVEAWFPRYGWLPFDPTPGRGALSGSYTASSPRFDLTGALYAFAARARAQGGFDLRKARSGPKVHFSVIEARNPRRFGSGAGTGIGELFRLLLVLAAALVLLVVAAKLAVRKARYLTRDPRTIARACIRELADFLADQGAKLPPSTTLRELSAVVEEDLGASPRAFVTAVSAARFGPPAPAGLAAREARRELKALRRDLRARLTRAERALGLVSLRSLGLTG